MYHLFCISFTVVVVIIIFYLIFIIIYLVLTKLSLSHPTNFTSCKIYFLLGGKRRSE